MPEDTDYDNAGEPDPTDGDYKDAYLQIPNYKFVQLPSGRVIYRKVYSSLDMI